jgi:two-component system chemotaxis response regulator CheY
MSLYNFRDFTILIVDDSDFMRNLVTDLCRNFGFGDILKAANVQDAIELVSQVEVDIVLCDWELGTEGSSGLDLIAFVRNDPVSPNPHLPIIMLSGYTETWRIQMARDKGATEYLRKPMSAHTVLERICSVIDNPRSLVEAPSFVGPDRRRREALYSGPDRRGGGGAPATTEDPSPE